MSSAQRLARGLRRGAPTGALTVLWFGAGAAGYMLFFKDVTEPTLPLMLFILVFGVGVWVPYFRFFFLVAEEVLTPEGPPTVWHGAAVGFSVAVFSIPPILLLRPDQAPVVEFLLSAPVFLTLVGVYRALRMLQRPGAGV